MKIAVVYNRVSEKVINLFGVPNREKYGLESIRRITSALEQTGHQVIALEGDKDLIDRLEEFMPRVLKNERPGLVFNLSYGIQGEARYTHVPGMLEMIGIPYVGSGPLAHSLALDKVVSKMIFRQHGLSTPDFAVLYAPGFAAPDLGYPLIVKPKNEARSFGLKIVEDEEQLRAAAAVLFDEFGQHVLVERYIPGREVNVGILGNNPAEAMLPVELLFGEGGPDIYTLEDKTGTSGRTVTPLCPAPLGDELTAQAKELAIGAFKALGCYDCARVDMRLDADGRLYILEVNSLPSLGQRGSYVAAAEAMGMDFAALVNRLVEVTSARYFGTPSPPTVGAATSTPQDQVFNFLTSNRDRLEKRVQAWTAVSSHTSDPVGLQAAVREAGRIFEDLGLRPVEELTDDRVAWTWATEAGLKGGTLFIGQLDVPLDPGGHRQAFRRDPEWLYGEGVGSSRAPLAMVEFALRALRHVRALRRTPVGVLLHTDEGRDCRYSAKLIRAACQQAGAVLVLRAGLPDDLAFTARRGLRKYRLVAEGAPTRLGAKERKPDVVQWFAERIGDVLALGSRRDKLGLGITDVRSDTFPSLLPHRITATILLSYRDARAADEIEVRIRDALGRKGPAWELEQVSDRPPLSARPTTDQLAAQLVEVAARWEIPLHLDSALAPSVAGLVPDTVGAVCGIGPIGRDLHTPNEAVQRISLVQRTLLIAEFLARDLKPPPKRQS